MDGRDQALPLSIDVFHVRCSPVVDRVELFDNGDVMIEFVETAVASRCRDYILREGSRHTPPVETEISMMLGGDPYVVLRCEGGFEASLAILQDNVVVREMPIFDPQDYQDVLLSFKIAALVHRQARNQSAQQDP